MILVQVFQFVLVEIQSVVDLIFFLFQGKKLLHIFSGCS